MAHSDYTPSDVMHRRTPLPLQRRFLLFGAPVLINTNYESIMRAAEASGFVPDTDTDYVSCMKWEIVGEPGIASVFGWDCDVSLGDHSLYLNMGLQQWFAFDLETRHGAGFVVVHNQDRALDTNAELYLASVAYNVGAGLRSALEKNCCD
ncbi:MAG: hypothetical protein JOZ33_16510 [Acidobacteriaceae bacterium]|nr:hypothetical protein [Acidobacteriaceae bacterium]